MTTWRHFAAKTFPAVVRELGLPAATDEHGGLTSCPRHNEPIGPISRLCKDCFHEAWEEVGRRYASAEHGAGSNPQAPRERQEGDAA
jgi:hypothetical protein